MVDRRFERRRKGMHKPLRERWIALAGALTLLPATTTGFAMVTMSNNVIGCSPTSATFMTASTPTFAIMAIANTAAPPTRSCGWFWSSASGTTSGNFSITDADGLPVELMEFSVENP